LCTVIRAENEQAGGIAGSGQNHAFRKAKFHFARREVSDHYRQAPLELFRVIGGLDARKYGARFFLADVPRWRLREQLAHEKASLGIYLGGHPYQEYADELNNFIKIKLSDLTLQFVAQAKGLGNGSGQPSRRGVPVVLAGIVAGVRIQQTRRGRMAVVTLDDGSAQIEMMVFNDEYERSRPWIKEDELLVVRGKAEMDSYTNNVRVTGDELYDFASARSHFAQQLALRSNGNASITQLKKLFVPYRDGKCPVQIHYRNDSASYQLRLGEEWQVTLHDDLLNDLRELLHEENVKVVYSISR